MLTADVEGEAEPAAGSRLRGAKRLSEGGQSLKLSTKAAVFKRASSLIGGKLVNWGARPPWPPLGAGPWVWTARKWSSYPVHIVDKSKGGN